MVLHACVFAALMPLVLGLQGRFWVVTDIHIADDYKSGTDPTSFCTNGTGPAGKYGYFNCDSPQYTLLPSALAFMNSMPADFLLWLGDSPTTYQEHPAHEETSEMIWGNINEVVSDITTAMPDMQVFPALGNHDAYPKDRIQPPPNDEYYSHFTQLWNHWLPPSAIETVGYSGYYTVLIVPGFRVVSFNTAYCDLTNPFILVNHSDHGNQWAWLTSTLQAAKVAGEKVIMMAHIPPGLVGIAPAPLWTDFCENQYKLLMDSYADVVVGQFYGHMHYDTWRGVKNSVTDIPINVAHLVPALTPRAGSGAPGSTSIPGKNPALRLYYYDTNTFDIYNYEQYYTDLLAGNEAGGLKWTVEYDAKSYYSIPDISAASMDKLSYRLLTEDPTWDLFFKVWFVGQEFKDCNNNCRLREACASRFMHLKQFSECTGVIE